MLHNTVAEKSRLGFIQYSQQVIQLMLCKDHIASEIALRSRCCCSQDASAYPAKGSFPSLVLRAFSEKRGYCSVKPILRCNTPLPFTYNGSWSTACWSCWNRSRLYYNKSKLHYFLGIQYAIINLPYVLINTSFYVWADPWWSICSLYSRPLCPLPTLMLSCFWHLWYLSHFSYTSTCLGERDETQEIPPSGDCLWLVQKENI